MKRFKQFNFIAILCLLLSACATTNPAVVYLAPQPTIESSDLGGGKQVYIQVVDARPQGVTASYASAKINPGQDVAKVFRAQLIRGLIADNFVPMASPTGKNNLLNVQILLINYGALNGVAATSTQTEVAVSVTVINSSGTFHKTYKAAGYSDNYLVFTHVDASQQVNLAVTNVLDNLLHDPSLLHFLAG